MNIMEIKKKHITYMKDRIDSRDCCDVEDFSDEVEYLIILSNLATSFFEMVEVGHYPSETHALRVAEEYLKAIRG